MNTTAPVIARNATSGHYSFEKAAVRGEVSRLPVNARGRKMDVSELVRLIRQTKA